MSPLSLAFSVHPQFEPAAVMVYGQPATEPEGGAKRWNRGRHVCVCVRVFVCVEEAVCVVRVRA